MPNPHHDTSLSVNSQCPHCRKGELACVIANYPSSDNYLQCERCDSTFVFWAQNDALPVIIVNNYVYVRTNRQITS